MISIRLAVASDTSSLVRLNEFVQDLHYQQRPDQFRPCVTDELATWFDTRLNDPATKCWIAEKDGAAVGYLLAILHHRASTPFAPERSWYEIDQLAVDSDYRRHGVGQGLLEHAIAALREDDSMSIEVSAWAFNAEMQRLLGRIGFSPKVIRFELAP